MSITEQIREEVMDIELFNAMKLVSRTTSEMLEYAQQNDLAMGCSYGEKEN